MSNLLFDGNERLKSGMYVTEAISKAGTWWDKYGRHMMKKVANSEREKDVFTPAGAGPAILVKGREVTTIPSGILMGEEWDYLNRRERLSVVRIWHDYYVIFPNESDGRTMGNTH